MPRFSRTPRCTSVSYNARHVCAVGQSHIHLTDVVFDFANNSQPGNCVNNGHSTVRSRRGPLYLFKVFGVHALARENDRNELLGLIANKQACHE
jgi:hypothetical protein